MLITLNILAEDIKTTNYQDSKDCAITRALKRAGVDAKDDGISIIHSSNSLLTTFDKEDYQAMSDKVVSMYLGDTIVKDFSFELDLDL